MRYVIIPLLVFNPTFTLAETQFTNHKCKNNAVAKLTSIQGKVIYDLDGNNQWQAAQLNDVLCEGSRVKVDTHSRASLTLADDINLRLDQSTVITLKGISPSKTTFLGLLKGFIHILSRTPQHLEISSPIANAGPEGTEFAMRVDDSSAAVWVYEGAVKFFNPQGSVHLTPGQQAQAQLGQAPRIQINIKPEDAINWALYYPPVFPFPDASQTIDTPIRQAIMDYRQGHVHQALSKLDALSAQQQTPFFHKVRGTMRLSVGQDALAMQDIQTLLATNPNDAEALALQAIRALSQNHKDQAYALATQAVQANPQSASAYSALSYVEQGQFQLNKAQAAADKASQLAPHDAMVWARKAELELSQGLTVESQHDANKALTLDANLERSQTVMGFSDLTRLDVNAAKRRFEKAIQLDSSSPLSRLGLGLAKIRQGDLEAGRQDLEMAAVLDPNDAIIRSYLGKAYYEERRSALADEQFTLAKVRDSKDPTAYFYDAINKQTTNRPIEALANMQKAIELNDNRAVFRSRLLLDKDIAARQAGLGRIYNNLGFEDPANRLAMKSLFADPGNYSAHRLLSDSYANKARAEISRSSEYLQSQLLQPLSYNPVQPSLAYTDLNIIRGIGPADTAFNEYNRLFERNGIRFTTTGIAGSNNTLGDEAALSGIANKFSFSLGQLHYTTDGFRENNDIKHNLYNAFAQYEFSPAFNLQAEYRHRETKHGDLALQGNSDFFDPSFRRKLNQNSYRLGLKMSPAQHSDILVSMIHSNLAETKNNNFASQGNEYTADLYLKTKSYDFETQYLFHDDLFNTIAGLGVFRTDNYRRRSSNNPRSVCPCFENYNTTQYFGYIYSHLKLWQTIDLTTGVSYDKYKDNDVIQGDDYGANINELNPKLGIVWKALDYLTLRAAGFKSVKSAIIDNQTLQPTQVAGFNQFFDDLNGTVAWQYGIGMDSIISKTVYTGVEAYKREPKIPDSTSSYAKTREELYRFYLNWAPKDYLAVNSEFRFENFRGSDDYLKFVETAYIPLEIRFFQKLGVFAALKGTYVNQRMNPDTETDGDFKSDFYLLDASIGYRFPKQYGLISLEAKNLFDTRFNYRDRQFQMNEQRSPDFIPERLLFARLTLNF